MQSLSYNTGSGARGLSGSAARPKSDELHVSRVGVIRSHSGSTIGSSGFWVRRTTDATTQGPGELVNNYSPSADPLFIEAVFALDQLTKQVGTNSCVKIADGFTAFQIASALHNGDPCATVVGADLGK
jgi:hypothetical protein